MLPTAWLTKLYFLARHRFFFDEWLSRLLIDPLLWTARAFDKLERAAVEGSEEKTPSAPERSLQEGAAE
jgi:hypothetical protein